MQSKLSTTHISAPTGTVSPSMTRSPLATAGRVGPGPSATPATSCVPPCGDGPHPGGTSGAVQLVRRCLPTRYAIPGNVTFLTVGDSRWPGVYSCTSDDNAIY